MDRSAKKMFFKSRFIGLYSRKKKCKINDIEFARFFCEKKNEKQKRLFNYFNCVHGCNV